MGLKTARPEKGRRMKFDAWWTPRGPMHLGVRDSGESFCGTVEATTRRTGGILYDSDDHETTASRVELHTSDAFRAPERYCKRCARHALRAMRQP